MTSVGACLLANDADGLGEKILQRRIEGKSWKEIADEYGLGSPSTARAKFKKLTGIDDFKSKGAALKKIAEEVKGLQSGQVKAANAAVKAVDDVAKDIPKPTPKPSGPKVPINAKIEDFRGQVVKTAEKKLDDAAQAVDSFYGPGKHSDVLDRLGKGDNYVQIKNATGVDFKDIDMLNTQRLLKITDGDVWKAYAQKPTSEYLYEEVNKAVNYLKGKGHTVEEIRKISGVPDEVVDAIGKGTWKIAPPGSSSPYIPPAPPKPDQVVEFGEVLHTGTNFKYRSQTEWDAWKNALGNDLDQAQMSAVRHYTGSGYGDMNGGLRGGKTPARVTNLDDALKPIPWDVKVTRQVNTNAFPSLGISRPSDLVDHVGKVYTDNGFMSTSIKEEGTWAGNIKLKINLPQGTKGRWVGGAGNISSHTHEQEFILSRGNNFLITRVETQAGGARATVFMDLIV